MSKFIKIILTIAALNLFSMAVFAADSGNSEPAVTENTVINTQLIDENSISLESVNSVESKATSSGSTFFLIIRMIFFLAVVIAIIYGVIWFLKKNMAVESGDDQFLRQVASINVAPGKSVQVVTLLDKKAFVLGVGEDGISLISEIENPDAKPSDYKELIDAMNLYSDTKRNVKKPRSFSDILDIFIPNGPKDKGVFSDSNSKVSDFLKKQRERINGGE